MIFGFPILNVAIWLPILFGNLKDSASIDSVVHSNRAEKWVH